MNSLSDLFFHWRIPADPDTVLSTADVVVTHEFGDQNYPSATTAKIVLRGVELSKRFNLPMICQYPGNEIAITERVLPVAVIQEHLRAPGEYLDTEEVNRQVASLCHKHTWSRVILCTHPHHLWRAKENLVHHGITAFVPYTGDIDYDEACPRSSLRTPLIFVPREILARFLYHQRGLL